MVDGTGHKFKAFGIDTPSGTFYRAGFHAVFMLASFFRELRMTDSPGLQAPVVKNNGNAGTQDRPDNRGRLGNVYFSDIQMNFVNI